jgi:1,4-dihydroxy-2-naphthoate octaprenyltransferase
LQKANALPVNGHLHLSSEILLSSDVLHRSTIQLLRFHFSLFLLPVFLFALSQVHHVNVFHAVLTFAILHLLVYPSSNGYNSYMDRDVTPIGGLASPLQPTRQLFFVTVAMDIVAVAVGLLISVFFCAGILLYILASRAYSYRRIRLKKYAVAGYLVVIFFQGGFTFLLCFHGLSDPMTYAVPVWPVVASTCLIGGYYPLTQIYQHEEDIKDGVRTISYQLGKRGTFVFCGIVFALATTSMFFAFETQAQLWLFYLFVVCMLPMVLYFMRWAMRVWKDDAAANFKNSLWMNLLASCCTTVFFLTLIILKGFE